MTRCNGGRPNAGLLTAGPASRASWAKGSAVEWGGGCCVLRNLRSWVCNCYRWTDLRRLPDAYACALDCGVRDRTFWGRNREGRDNDAPKGSGGITDLMAGCSLDPTFPVIQLTRAAARKLIWIELRNAMTV